jgi:hypothetical protein
VSVRSDILLWAQRTVAKKGAQAHQLLDIDAEADLDEAQAAFHRIARMAHPDLHRTMLTPEEHELVTLAYSRVTGAYQDFRSQRMQTRPKPVRDEAAGIPVPDAAPPPPTVSGASGAMTSKALVYYRKAEGALRRGDLKGAILQLKMAIAADPVSPMLRTALGEVEAEVSKKP